MRISMTMITTMTVTMVLILLSTQVQAQYFKNTTDIESAIQMTGGTLGFATENNDNEETLLGRRRDLESYDFSINPIYGYFIRDNLLIGGIVSYMFSKSNEVTRWEEGIIGPPTAQRQDVRSVSHGFLLAPLLRYYIPLGNSGRAYLFVHTHLGLGYQEGKTEREDTGGNITRIPSDRFGLELVFRPGFTIFVYEGFAFEITIGSLGLSTVYEEIGEGEDKSTKWSNDFDLIFDVDLLTINFGLVGYF